MTIARGLKTSSPVKVEAGEHEAIAGGFGDPNPGRAERAGNLAGRPRSSRRHRPLLHGTGGAVTAERFIRHALQDRVGVEGRPRCPLPRSTDGRYNKTREPAD